MTSLPGHYAVCEEGALKEHAGLKTHEREASESKDAPSRGGETSDDGPQFGGWLGPRLVVHAASLLAARRSGAKMGPTLALRPRCAYNATEGAACPKLECDHGLNVNQLYLQFDARENNVG